MYYLSANAYQGPGDIIAGWIAWWGLRAFSNAVAATGTQPAINVRRTSDSATMDILILPSGKFDVATLTTFLTSTTGFITKWYDQSGNGRDVVQATTAKQAQILLTGGPSGGVSAKYVGSSSQGYATAGNVAFPTASISFVAIRTANFTSIMPVVHSNGPASGFFNSANTIYWFAGLNVSVTATDSVWHAANSTFTAGAGSSINVDGVRTTGNVSSSASSLTLEFGSGISGGQFLTGNLVEGGINSNQFSSAQQTAMNSNQHGSNGWNF